MSADDFGKRSSVGAQTYHSGTEIVDSAGEDCSESYPEEGGRTEHYAHYSAENGAETRDVQKLNKKHSPGGEGAVIDVVAARYGRHGPRGVGAQQAIYQQTIEEIAPYENSE